MNKTSRQTGGIRFMLGVMLLGSVAGCVHESRHRADYYVPPPDYAEGGGVVRDDYFYYPGYQVYYSSYRRQYIYQDRGAWVSRPAPPHVSVAVLFASPSVRLGFHDAPEIHHSRVIQQYPKHWKPPGKHRNHESDQRSNGKGHDRNDRH